MDSSQDKWTIINKSTCKDSVKEPLKTMNHSTKQTIFKILVNYYYYYSLTKYSIPANGFEPNNFASKIYLLL